MDQIYAQRFELKPQRAGVQIASGSKVRISQRDSEAVDGSCSGGTSAGVHVAGEVARTDAVQVQRAPEQHLARLQRRHLRGHHQSDDTYTGYLTVG